MARFSAAYIQHRQRGPFPNRVDPWAEAGRYFQQIHSGMINALQDQLQDSLNALGYQAGKEASLQIFAGRQPDLYVQDTETLRPSPPVWDYAAAATAIELEPGAVVSEEAPEFEALHISAMQDGELVTVVEIVSPCNKLHLPEMAAYQEQRSRLFVENGVNVVEIDLTRSVKRLLSHHLTRDYPYHTAIYLPGALPRVIVTALEETIKPFALPLRADVVPVALYDAYTHAYRRGAIAGLIMQETGYDEAHLPFPSLLSEPQRHATLAAVDTWREALAHLRESNT